MKRWWGIRHIRWAWHSYWLNRWVEASGALCASAADEAYLEAIWKGEV